MEKLTIETPFITLSQFLKIADICSSGGQVKWFLAEHEVLVNGELDDRRGRKLYPGDNIEIQGFGQFMITQAE